MDHYAAHIGGRGVDDAVRHLQLDRATHEPAVDGHEDSLRRTPEFAYVALELGHVGSKPQRPEVRLGPLGEHHGLVAADVPLPRSEAHTSELQSLMRIS